MTVASDFPTFVLPSHRRDMYSKTSAFLLAAFHITSMCGPLGKLGEVHIQSLAIRVDN
jgi:hypothetical protein